MWMSARTDRWSSRCRPGSKAFSTTFGNGRSRSMTASFVGDVGFAGPDKGEGRQVPATAARLQGRGAGWLLRLPLGTNNIFVFLRAFFQDPAKLDAGEADRADEHLSARTKRTAPSRCSFPMRRAFRATCCRSGRQRFRTAQAVHRQRGRNSLSPIGAACWRPSASSRASRSSRMTHQGDSRSGRENRLQDEPGDRLRAVVGGVSMEGLPGPSVDQPAVGNSSKAGPELNLEWLNIASGLSAISTRRINFFTNYYSVSPVMALEDAGPGARHT